MQFSGISHHLDDAKAQGRNWRAPRDGGASLVEYALLIALIALVCLAAVTILGAETGESFSEFGSEVRAA